MRRAANQGNPGINTSANMPRAYGQAGQSGHQSQLNQYPVPANGHGQAQTIYDGSDDEDAIGYGNAHHGGNRHNQNAFSNNPGQQGGFNARGNMAGQFDGRMHVYRGGNAWVPNGNGNHMNGNGYGQNGNNPTGYGGNGYGGNGFGPNNGHGGRNGPSGFY